MSIVQKFYDNIAPHYDKLFLNWKETTEEQAKILQKIFNDFTDNKKPEVLDCACGIGTQAIGLALLGYNVTASDISVEELKEAKTRAENANVKICFKVADFRKLCEAFSEKFDIIIAMDNALPHMLTKEDLQKAISSIANQINENGIFVGSIRDYDDIIKKKPYYSPPYIYKNEKGMRISFQSWQWEDENYKLTQYIIEDEGELKVNKFECEYRAVLREELTNLFKVNGFKEVMWLFPEETDFYQPVIVAKK